MSEVKTSLFPYYSVSQMNTFLSCPMKYKYRYVDGISSLQTATLVFGNSTHSALEYNFAQKVFSRKDMPARDVVDVFAHNMELSKEAPGVEWAGKYWDEIDTGKRLIELYIDAYAKPIMPRAVEKEVIIQVPEVSKPFKGIIDLMSTDIKVIDFKTTSKTPTDNDVFRYLLQLSSYTYSMIQARNDRSLFSDVDSEKIQRMQKFDTYLHYFIKTKTPKIVIKNIPRSRKDLRRFVEIVKSVCGSIEKGVFYPNHGSPLCNPKYCPYWERCNNELHDDSYIVSLLKKREEADG